MLLVAVALLVLGQCNPKQAEPEARLAECRRDLAMCEHLTYECAVAAPSEAYASRGKGAEGP